MVKKLNIDFYEWNPSMFQTNATLKLITSDYQSVKTDFNDIEKLDIYAGENFLAAFYSI